MVELLICNQSIWIRILYPALKFNGMLPNGKALAFGASLRWFDSIHPSLIKTEIEITTHEESLKILIETPPNIDYEEYWERVNKISEKDHIAFEEEDKKLKMNNFNFHKFFDL